MQELFLAAGRIWPGMSKDVHLYVKSCQKCVVGKTPELAAHAPLEHVCTSEPVSGTPDVITTSENFSCDQSSSEPEHTSGPENGSESLPVFEVDASSFVQESDIRPIPVICTQSTCGCLPLHDTT